MSIVKHIKDHEKLGIYPYPKITRLMMPGGYTQSIPNNTATPISWPTVPNPLQDDVGAWSDADPTHLTVPAGYTHMRVCFHVEWGIQAGGYRSLRMNVDDLAVAEPYYSPTDVHDGNGTISDHSDCTSMLIDCTPGDQLSVVARQNSGVAIDIGGTQANYFIVEWYP